MAANTHSEDGDLGFQVAPMVDVVFVLMLFFLACVSFEKANLSFGAKFGEGQFDRTIMVPIDLRIAASGDVFLQDRLIGAADDRDLNVLREWLLRAKQDFGMKDTIVISPAPTVSNQRLTEVMSAIAAAEWKKVTFR